MTGTPLVTSRLCGIVAKDEFVLNMLHPLS